MRFVFPTMALFGVFSLVAGIVERGEYHTPCPWFVPTLIILGVFGTLFGIVMSLEWDDDEWDY